MQIAKQPTQLNKAGDTSNLLSSEVDKKTNTATAAERKEEGDRQKQQKETSAFLNAKNEPCERHGLTRCVLCSLNFNPSKPTNSTLKPLGVSSMSEKDKISTMASKNLSSLDELKSNTTQLKSMATSMPSIETSKSGSSNYFNAFLGSSTLGNNSSDGGGDGGGGSGKPCERHFLMNCVLCSRDVFGAKSNDTRNNNSSFVTPQGSPLKPSPLVNNSTDVLCDRHNLKNCFLCNLTNKQKTQPDMFMQGSSNSYANVSSMMSQQRQPQQQQQQQVQQQQYQQQSQQPQISQDAYATYNAMKASPLQHGNSYGGISLGSIPYSANTGMLGAMGVSSAGLGGNGVLGPGNMSGFSPPSGQMGMYGQQMQPPQMQLMPQMPQQQQMQPQMQQQQQMQPQMQQPSAYQPYGNGAGVSPDVHGQPVGQPSTANPIPMDKYQFGNEPTLNLGFSTTRSIASPGASSQGSFSQERMMTADSYQSEVHSIDEGSEAEDEEEDGHETSVTWNEEELKQQQSSKKKGGGYGVGNRYGQATKSDANKGKNKSTITYAKDWDNNGGSPPKKRKGAGGNNNQPSSNQSSSKRGGGNAYNVGVKKLKAQNERRIKAARDGPKQPKKVQAVSKRKNKEDADTLSRARMAIESASAILLDVGPA